MSGGSFNYAYINVKELAEGQAFIGIKALEIISKLMKDVEYAESGDSAWDTQMAGEWYKSVYDLCCLANNEEPRGELQPPHAPTHHPEGKACCVFCGSEKKYWNEAFKHIKNKGD